MRVVSRALTVVPPAERSAAQIAFLRQAAEAVGWQRPEQAEAALRRATDLTQVGLEALIDSGRLCVWEAYRPDGTRLLRWEVLV